ncbi:MAG: hypothetical protein JWL90_3968 [Chthoniobacteraceae bacterium]|nr:hypothetical protein [Chthoniobacteraceae bacterium]
MPTWRAWLLVLLVAGTLGPFGLRAIHDFLAVNAPVIGTETLVMEGWANDATVAATIREFNQGHYKRLYVTGGPIDKGAPLFKYKTYAEVGAATLVAFGFNPALVHAIPAPEMIRDRTYGSAVAFKEGLKAGPVSSFNVVSTGPHCRRTWLLYQRACGADCEVGIISVDDLMFDRQRWWASSMGFRSVSDELLAYCYARFFFKAE